MQERLQSLRVRISEIEAEKDSTVKAGHCFRHAVVEWSSVVADIPEECSAWAVRSFFIFETKRMGHDGSAGPVGCLSSKFSE